MSQQRSGFFLLLALLLPGWSLACDRTSCFPEYMADSNHYVEYWVGDWSLVISVPHGGDLRPDSIPQRGRGCWIDGRCVYAHGCGTTSSSCSSSTSKDSYTLNIATALRQELQRLTNGRKAHMIVNQLHRSRYVARLIMGNRFQYYSDAVVYIFVLLPIFNIKLMK